MVSEAFVSSQATHFTSIDDHSVYALCRITVNDDDSSANPLIVSKICELPLEDYERYPEPFTACHYRTAVTIIGKKYRPPTLSNPSTPGSRSLSCRMLLITRFSWSDNNKHHQPTFTWKLFSNVMDIYNGPPLVDIGSGRVVLQGSKLSNKSQKTVLDFALLHT